MKHIFTACILMISLGCGHNMYMERETTGIGVLVPIGDGALGVSIGSMKTISATMRGGSSIETTSSASGGLFAGAGAESKITTFKTNAQLNEKNLVDVLISPDVPSEVKIELAKNLSDAAKAPKFMPSVLQTDASTIHLGSEAIQSNNVEQIQPHSTGIDKVIESVTTVTSNTISDANHTINNTLDNITDWAHMSKLLAIVGAICTVLILWMKKSNNNNTDDPIPDLEDIDGNHEDNPPPSDDPKPSNPSPKQTTKKEPVTLKGKTIWQKMAIIITGIWTLISKIPPELKMKIVDAIKKFFMRKRKEANKQTNK